MSSGFGSRFLEDSIFRSVFKRDPPARGTAVHFFLKNRTKIALAGKTGFFRDPGKRIIIAGQQTHRMVQTRSHYKLQRAGADVFPENLPEPDFLDLNMLCNVQNREIRCNIPVYEIQKFRNSRIRKLAETGMKMSGADAFDKKLPEYMPSEPHLEILPM